MGHKLAEGKGLREGWHSKELWKSVEKAKTSLQKQALRVGYSNRLCN